MQNEHDAATRETIAQLNRDAMSRVKEETGLTFRADSWQLWRPTARTRGTIRGVVESVTCLGTDGILGAFVFDFDQTHASLGSAFFGHVAHFEWDEERKLKVPVKEEDGTERTVTITQHRGAPPTLYSAAKCAQQRRKDQASGQPRRKATSKKVSKLLATLEEMGL